MQFLQHLQENIHYFLATANFTAMHVPKQLKQELTEITTILAPLYHYQSIRMQDNCVLWEGQNAEKLAILVEPALKELDSEMSLLLKRMQCYHLVILSENIHQYSELPLLRHHPFTFICIHPEKVAI